MSYGYGLGVYWEDYNDPEETDSDWCNTCQDYLGQCRCPEVSVIEVACGKCGKLHNALDEGSNTETTCGDCLRPNFGDGWEPPF